ncbi:MULTISPECIES: hypothetical protein [Gammaproteobacteria]|uniref:hypothetical protein n=1 Tax=Gammaproteobacteria TaxID=1236 RepID=UPI0027F19B2C|nr:hypothetical protein [Vibrio cholerae]MDX5050555.1 hypothetical protein [Vibrio cholerae]CAJ0563720.1 hypothetical protein DJICPGNB_19685 [Proteus mirabilis]
MIVNAVIKFPVMQITPKFIMGSILNEGQLLTVGEQNLRKGCFNDCYIVDSDGNKFKVISAHISKRERVFRLLNIFPLYRIVKVDIELSDAKKTNLDDFKNEVVAKIKKNKWMKSSDESESEVFQYLYEAKSFEELICRVGIYN